MELYDKGAERTILGKILFAPEIADYVAGKLTPDDFFDVTYKETFRGISELVKEGKTVTAVTLADQLKDKVPVDLSFIMELTDHITTSVGIRDEVKVVKKLSDYRKADKLADEIKEAIRKGSEIEEVSKAADETFSEMNRDERGPKNVREVLFDVTDEIETLSKNGGDITGIPSGFTDLDKKTAGFHPGELIIVGARPAMGKSAFGLNIVQYASMMKDKTCLVFSLEMSAESLVKRILSNLSGVESSKLRTGQLDDDDWKAVAQAIGLFDRTNIFIDDRSGLTVNDIKTAAKQIKQRHGLDLVLVDYLQLVVGHAESRQLEISEISRNLKGMAKDLECPVIALSQLSRGLEGRSDKRPMLADLRESGAIEQDADLVMFLYRDEYYNPDSQDIGVAEVIIAKQRNGSTGTVRLAFIGELTKFANLLEGQ